MASVITGERTNVSLNEDSELVDLHELAKGWKAAIARANDPATRYVAELKGIIMYNITVLLLCYILLECLFFFWSNYVLFRSEFDKILFFIIVINVSLYLYYLQT